MNTAAIPAPGASTLASRQSERIRRAVHRERKDGLRLALRLRLAVMVLVGLYLLRSGLRWDQFVNLASLAGLCLAGFVQYRIAGTRFDRPATMALFPLVDVLLVVFAVSFAIEWEGKFPRTVLDEERPASWFYLLLALQALAYRPWLAAWSGLVTAAVWMAMLIWLLRYPGAYAWLAFAIPPDTGLADGVRAVLAAYYDPLFVNAEIWMREALIAILCGAILAVAVRRSQGMIFRALQAERSRANLARYFSPSMVDQLAEQDQPFEAAREQDIGVLFADMVGFTRIAENSTPEELIRLLREFHRRVAQAVFAHGGTLDKFIGDCVMATFGTPSAGADDATRTLACCRAIAAAVEGWNAERRAAGSPPVRIGIGAHYGPVVLGDIGDERRLEFAVLGDTVNVASRLEALTRTLACTILASDELVRAARAESDRIETLLEGFARIAPQELRNRDERVEAWAWRRNGR